MKSNSAAGSYENASLEPLCWTGADRDVGAAPRLRRLSDWYGLAPDADLVLPHRPAAGKPSRLARLAAPILDDLAAELHEDVVILLGDTSGYIADRRGDPKVASELDMLGATQGASCSESVSGNNGIGTVLEEGRSIAVVGAEHFVAKLQKWAAAGAPIVHPVTRRTIGAISLCTRVEDWNPLLQVIAKRAAADIAAAHQNVNSHHDEFIDQFLKMARQSRHPIVGLSGEFVVCNPVACALLEPGDYTLLRERVQLQMRDSGTQLILTTGLCCKLRVHRLEMQGGSAGFLVELVVQAEEDDASRHGSRTGTAPPNEFSRAVDAATRRWRAGRPVMLIGEPGVGKLSVARDLTGPEVATILDLRLERSDPGWVADVRALLVRERAVILQHVDALSQDGVSALTSVIDERTRQPSTAWLIATVTGATLPAHVRELVDRLWEPIVIPPLRDRTEDIPRMVQVLARRAGSKQDLRFDPRVVQALTRAHWPGNVRQLEGLVSRLVEEHEGWEVRLEHLPVDFHEMLAPVRLSKVERFERSAIAEAMRATHGNKSDAAAMLGIARSTLYRKLVRYGLAGLIQ